MYLLENILGLSELSGCHKVPCILNIERSFLSYRVKTMVTDDMATVDVAAAAAMLLP